MGAALSFAALDAAGDAEAIARAARELRPMAERWMAEGHDSDHVARAVTAFNDRLTQRLIAVTGAERVFADAGACWIALGSEGRMEQTLASDQDNAIVFADGGQASSRRAVLLPLAGRINDALDTCGLARCRGHVMAGNPEWCLSAAEWRARFAAWMDRPDPQALLNAAIFFDFRPICGAEAPVRALQVWLGAYAPGRSQFLLLLAHNALENMPPLGLLGRLRRARAGEFPGTIDLKVNGVQPFVEAARVYALAGGVEATHTLDRLRAAGRARRVPEIEIEGWASAFRAIQQARLAHNVAQLGSGESAHNHVDPEALDAVSRDALHAAFRTARSLQQRFARDFPATAAGFGA